MDTQDTKVSANRQKKIEIVGNLSEKLGKTKAIVFTNYQGLTHKQLEGLKKTIKPMQAEFVVAKNSLVLRALEANKIKVEDEKQFDGPTGTLLIYDDYVGPLKTLAKLIKELGIPSVKFGIMDNENISGEQILKISALPSKETLLTQVVLTLKSPIFGLHRSLNWNLQKLVMTLGAISASKPAIAADAPVVVELAVSEPAAEVPVVEAPAETVTESTPPTEPETILAETAEEKKAEEPETQTENKEEVKNEGGEN